MQQLRNKYLIVPAVLVGSFFLTLLHLYASGEFKGWSDFPDVANHASFSATMMTIGWLFLRSPWAARITQVMGETKESGPAGDTTTQMKVTVEQPPLEPKGNS